MNEEKEIWKQIPSFPNYAASNLGRIKNIKKDKIMIPQLVDLNREYRQVHLSRNGKSYFKKVARMVWEAFNECECENTINHIDSNPSNNHIDNLECIPLLENLKKRNIYKKKNKYNLTDEIRKNILKEYQDGDTIYFISKKYKIPSNYLYLTIKRGSWKHLCWKDDTENTNNLRNG